MKTRAVYSILQYCSGDGLLLSSLQSLALSHSLFSLTLPPSLPPSLFFWFKSLDTKDRRCSSFSLSTSAFHTEKWRRHYNPPAGFTLFKNTGFLNPIIGKSSLIQRSWNRGTSSASILPDGPYWHSFPFSSTTTLTISQNNLHLPP